MHALLRKELRGLLPFILLVIFLSGTNLLDEFLIKIPHLRPLGAIREDYSEGGAAGSLLLLIFALALTYGLLVRERDDGTQEFLDALPVSRTSIFMAKIMAVLMVLGLIAVLDFATILLLQYLSRTSLDPELHLDFLVTRAFLNLSQLWVFMTLGLALSFLRRFGWLTAGLLIWAYLLLRQLAPSVEVFNVLALSDENMLGQRLVIPWPQLIAQGLLSCVLLAISYTLYLGAGDRLLRALQNLDQSRWGSALLFAGSTGIVIVGVSLFVFTWDSEDDSAVGDLEEATVTFPSWNTSRSSSTHYRFAYPSNLTRQVRPLVAAADGVHQRVREFLDAPAGAPIDVDATEALPSHLAGFAQWDKLRLDLNALPAKTSLESVLAHETAHVFLERLSDSRLTQKLNSTRFFHEGVASYVEYHLFDARQPVDVFYSVAAVMRSRKLVNFDEMVDDEKFARRHDPDLAYPLGLVFVESLIERYDRQAIANLARAMDRDDAPEGLEGLELWRDTFQACHYNLDDVLDAFFARLDREVEQRQAWIDSLPRPRAVLEFDPLIIELKVIMSETEGWNPVCRFRSSLDTPQALYINGYLDEDKVCFMPSSSFPAGVVWYQIGVTHRDGHTIYEPWRSATMRSQ